MEDDVRKVNGDCLHLWMCQDIEFVKIPLEIKRDNKSVILISAVPFQIQNFPPLVNQPF